MNFNKIAFIIICLITPIFSISLQAQEPPKQGETGITEEEIDIVKPYEPVLEDAAKLDFSPDLPSSEDLDQNRPKFGPNDFFVPNRFLTMTYTPPKLRPLRYRKARKRIEKGEEGGALNNFWLKAGYGNLNTPLVELAASTGKSDEYILGAHASYISSDGPIDHQDYRNIAGHLYGKYYLGGALEGNYVGFDATYKRNQAFYYGYNHKADSLFPADKKDIEVLYNDIGISGEFGNSIENDFDTDYYLKANYNYYFNERGTQPKEQNIVLNGRINRRVSTIVELGLNGHGHFSSFKSENTQSNLMLNLTPHLTFRTAVGAFSLGGSALIDGSDIAGFPYVDLEGYIIPERVILYGGWQKELIKNNYKTLSEANPWVNTELNLQNSTKESRYVGVRGNIASLVTYNIKAYQTITEDQPLFVPLNSLVLADTAKFVAAYDSSMTAYGGLAEVTYKYSKQIHATLGLNINQYTPSEAEKAWHLPSLRLNLRGDFFPVEKLKLTADIFMIDGMYGRNSAGVAKKLDSAVDINFAANFRAHKNVSLFAQVNNLASMKYQRFINYPVYGLNALGGITVRF